MMIAAKSREAICSARAKVSGADHRAENRHAQEVERHRPSLRFDGGHRRLWLQANLRRPHQSVWRQKLHRDNCRRHDKSDRSGNPHDCARSRLIAERRNPKTWRVRIGRVSNPVIEGKKSCQGGILKVGQQKVRDHCPARPVGMAGPGLHDVPPEEESCREKTEVLHLVPTGRTQGEFVEVWEVPKNVAKNEEHPTNDRMHESVEKALQQRPKKKWPQHPADQVARKPAEQRQLRRAQEQQRWSNHRQQEVLHHMRRQ